MTTTSSAADADQHMPFPTFEWVLQGSCDLVVPHLTLTAPQLVWNDEHFHVCATSADDEHEPQLFRIELGDSPVGAINFLPLPESRTLMSLYRCSDLGESCTRKDGDAIVRGFVGALLNRLERLGFLVRDPDTPTARRLGFRALHAGDS